MYLIKRITCLIGLTMSIFSFTTTAQSLSKTAQEAIGDRISPIGSAYLDGEIGTHNVATIAAKPAEPRSGEQVYNSYCVACHATGVAGAPVKGNKAAWEPRLAQGMDKLLEHAIKGFNAMPARGTCMDCSDDEMADTVKFLTKNMN
ncbi:cytochrome c, class I [Psychromonas sp. CNPT3]|uniref:c-type cytochrome n=1 Tax=Psychromonas sp. CNPT3 TaxID=314282 RepID=UPI00006E5085|nr:cytochrome c5 family protein [Psychromonas sp. CNPT3]AGH82464.1 cytochrome c, class I [Psychromonas sp. CNPT3]